MNMDIHMSGSTVKNHISLKLVFEYSVTLKNSYQSWFLVYLQLPQARLLQHPRLLQVRKLIIQIIIQQSCQVKVWKEKYGETRILLPKPNKNENHRHPGVAARIQRENFVDDRVPERRDSHASSSHEPSLEPMRSVDLVNTVLKLTSRRPKLRDLPEDQNHKGPCRRRIGRVVPRAENFGDLITADHKVLSEGCESRNNHRYAVVVQDLATQWIQSYPCKTKTSHETQRSLQKFLEPDRKPKVIYTNNSLEFGKACEDLSWNH